MRTLFFSLLLLMSLPSPGQTGNVKFLGVPLDGTIQQFQEKLTAEGCSHDKETTGDDGRYRTFRDKRRKHSKQILGTGTIY